MVAILSTQNLNVETLGQVFTPPWLVEDMWGLCKNRGRTLEPACGAGAFYRADKCMTLIEKDADIAVHDSALMMDFFDYPLSEKFDTIIGNPPYVRCRDISSDTAKKLNDDIFDGHANLYYHFIRKSVQHLNHGGELIFVTPRDFIRATGAGRLNEWLYKQGAFTHFKDYGDENIFGEFSPNCAVWRYVKGRRSRKMNDGRIFRCVNGLLYFGGDGGSRLGDYFDVKVGAVSGADDVFTHKNGNKTFVCSHTRRTGECRKMIYNKKRPELKPHRKRLLARKIRKFSEENWWEWGRGYPERDDERIYVNQKTRHESPFFTHEAKSFDGSVLALFPRSPMVLEKMRDTLNRAAWEELGFVTGGRFIFSQRSLENAILPDIF